MDYVSEDSARLSGRVNLLARLISVTLLLGWTPTLCAQVPEVKVWEFEPYRVQLWYAFSPEVTVSQLAKDAFLQHLHDELERTFAAAWRLSHRSAPRQLQALFQADMDQLTLEQIQQNELVLVVSAEDEATKSIRSYEAAVAGLTEVAVTQSVMDALNSASELQADEATLALAKKCRVDNAAVDRLLNGQIASALVPRSALAEDNKSLRQIVTLLPWQTESLFRTTDKLFFLNIGMKGQHFEFQLRELDCSMRFLGPTFAASATDWLHAWRVAATLFPQAFAPVARVEESTTNTASLLLRAGGLIVDDSNPAVIQVGDVLHPMVRRDDRNGVPILLQSQAWTYAVVTETDRSKMQANVYSYSGGVGLGRGNRRTQRLLLRVRPTTQATDIRVVVGMTDEPQSGCFVYRRDLLTSEFEYLGRTDWRGHFRIEVPGHYGAVLPEEIRRRKYQALRDAQAKTNNVPATAADAADLDDPLDTEAYEIPLRAPLMQIYIKNGEKVTGKLSMVPGLEEVSVANLPDDRRRLETEAFLRGFQSDIVDLIGLRNLYGARIKLYLKNQEIDKAKQALSELQDLGNFSDMARELDLIQRRMIDESNGEIPRHAKPQIDSMFQSTRNLLQKYLQDGLAEESRRLIAAAESTN
ncbi:MAG: hypothetical protein KDB22_13320 [Planctomycetales bacterium]|nr:hypothetical protein [Planctomycetales bacterium]